MKFVYLAMAILGTIIPMLAFIPWAVTHGADPAAFFDAMFANKISTFFALDTIVSAGVVFVMAYHFKKQGVRWVWIPILSTIIVGVSQGLPLLMYLKVAHQDAD